ncbi:unnamed protein product [Amoebophrya sp. A120]|nr:unnamed protein product [Amoebophrya sp. A120]|eukprot:GSA120T00006593001.1
MELSHLVVAPFGAEVGRGTKSGRSSGSSTPVGVKSTRSAKNVKPPTVSTTDIKATRPSSATVTPTGAKKISHPDEQASSYNPYQQSNKAPAMGKQLLHYGTRHIREQDQDKLFHSKSSVVKSESNIQLYLRNAALKSPSAASGGFRHEEQSADQEPGPIMTTSTIDENSFRRPAESTSCTAVSGVAATQSSFWSSGATTHGLAVGKENGDVHRRERLCAILQRAEELLNATSKSDIIALRQEFQQRPDPSSSSGDHRNAGVVPSGREEVLRSSKRLAPGSRPGSAYNCSTNKGSLPFSSRGSATTLRPGSAHPASRSVSTTSVLLHPQKKDSNSGSSTAQHVPPAQFGSNSSGTSRGGNAGLGGPAQTAMRTSKTNTSSTESLKRRTLLHCSSTTNKKGREKTTFTQTNLRPHEKLDKGEGPDHLSHVDRFFPPPHMRDGAWQRSWGVANRFKLQITFGSATPGGNGYYKYSASISKRKMKGTDYSNLMRSTPSFGIGERCKVERRKEDPPMYNVMQSIGHGARTTLFSAGRPSSADPRLRAKDQPGPGEYPLPSAFDPPRGRYISPNLSRRPQSSYGKLQRTSTVADN